MAFPLCLALAGGWVTIISLFLLGSLLLFAALVLVFRRGGLSYRED